MVVSRSEVGSSVVTNTKKTLDTFVNIWKIATGTHEKRQQDTNKEKWDTWFWQIWHLIAVCQVNSDYTKKSVRLYRYCYIEDNT